MIIKYVGITKEASGLIEHLRQSPDETESDIIVRALSPLRKSESPTSPKYLEIGQGVKLRVGEKVMLFLSEDAKRSSAPDAVAEAHEDGLYTDGEKVQPSKGSVLQPAMKRAQERKNHRNKLGDLISLSAYRQWHVVRDGKFVPVSELKDPALARKRGHAMARIDATAEELGL